jgi:two-component system, NarL family, sensor kinase
VTGAALQAFTPAVSTWDDIVDLATLAVVCVPVGAFVEARVPGQPIGRLLLAGGLIAAVATATSSGNGPTFALWLGSWSWWPSYALFPLALLLFPSGRLPDGRLRWRLGFAAGVLGIAASTGGLAVAGLLNRDAMLVSITGDEVHGPARALLDLAVAGTAMTLLAFGFAVISLRARWRHADPVERRQVGLLLVAGAIAAVGVVLDNLLVLPGMWVVAIAPIPLAIGVAIVRHQLYDLDAFLNRSLLLGATSAVLLAAWAATVVVAERLLHTQSRLTALLGAAIVAVLVQPIYHRLRRSITRALYGRRSEPDAVIAGVVREMNALTMSSDPLTDLAAKVAQSLRLPYAALKLGETGSAVTEHIEVGRRIEQPQAFDLRYRGEHLGQLAVCNRSVGEQFTRAERDLLADLAASIAVTVHVVQQSRQIQRSREHVVRAREEERKRLRRELHDGIGGGLAGVSIMVGAAGEATRDLAATTALETVEHRLSAIAADLRALVDDMRPPALDQLGLVGAIRLHAESLSSGRGLAIGVIDSIGDRSLPAAVEVAAYRIASEAIANVARHSGANRCRVTVGCQGARLEIAIDDDGHGELIEREGGVGLESMQERAASLGGVCEWTARRGEGVRVWCTLPLEAV